MANEEALELGSLSDLLGAVAWPIVVLGLALLFFRSIRALLARPDVDVSVAGVLKLSGQDPAAAADALARAAADKEGGATQDTIEEQIATTTKQVGKLSHDPRVLWVDDRPSNNRYEADALTALGIIIDLSTSTQDALARMATTGPYDAIISDMGRPRDSSAGYTLLDALRRAGNQTPYVIYASSRDPDHFDEAVSHGAVGCTNRPTELVQLVSRALRLNPPEPS